MERLFVHDVKESLLRGRSGGLTTSLKLARGLEAAGYRILGTQFDAVYSGTDIDLVATPVSYANLTPLGVTSTSPTPST